MEQLKKSLVTLETEKFLKSVKYTQYKMKRVNMLLKLVLFSFSLFLSIEALGQTSAEIQNIWIDYDVTENYQKGMRIHVKFSVEGMLNKQGECTVWFYKADGTALTDYNRKCYTDDGKVATYENFKPSYTNSQFEDFKIFMPYNELHLAEGEFQLKFCVGIFDDIDKKIANSDYKYFTFRNYSTPTYTTPTYTTPAYTTPAYTTPTVNCATLQQNYTKYKSELASCERNKQRAMDSGNYVVATSYNSIISKWNDMIYDLQRQAINAGCTLY